MTGIVYACVLLLLHVPTCVTIDGSFAVTEETTNGYVGSIKDLQVLRDKYTDAQIDGLEFSIVTFGDDDDGSRFTITETPHALRTSQPIDREEICPSLVKCIINLQVAASNSDFLEIEVEILDENDNAPKFSVSSVGIDIPEGPPPDGNYPLDIVAVDPDSPANGVTGYALSGADGVFNVVYLPEFGSIELTVIQDLDRERQDFYEVTLTALSGVLSSPIPLNISVTDINDNPPEFDTIAFPNGITVQEDFEIGQTILQVKASDADMGRNAKVSYSLSVTADRSVQQTFLINDEDGDLSLKKKLDYEVQPEYELIVVASDNGDIRKSATATIIVYVADVNDNPPKVSTSAVFKRVLSELT